MNLSLFPGSHHVTPEEVRHKALGTIRDELKERLVYFEDQNQLIERQRIQERTMHDLEMIREIGFCKGIENYSRILVSVFQEILLLAYLIISLRIFFYLLMSLIRPCLKFELCITVTVLGNSL